MTPVLAAAFSLRAPDARKRTPAATSSLARQAVRQSARALGALARRPASLLVTLVALNALVLPYQGLVHDAQLYAAQVLHRIDPSYLGTDLFFRYGSQDQYSAFSLVVAPLARLLGMPWAFVLVYLLCKALLFWAMLRLVRALVPGKVAGSLILLVLAVSTLRYGGLGVFHVNEGFLTPRLPATALVLLALERLLCGRAGLALSLVLLACLMHPIMGAPGVAVVGLYWASRRLTRRQFQALLAAGLVGLAAVLAWQPLGARVLGWMDPQWRTEVRHASPYASPLDWPASDWLRALLSLGILSWAAWTDRHRPPQSRLAVVAAVVGVAGVLLSALGTVTGYALLVQAQPYRALWLVSFLQVPLGFRLALRLWPRGEPQRLFALAVVGYLVLQRLDIELWLFALCLPVLALAWRGLGPRPRVAGWVWRSVALSLALAILGGAATILALLASNGEALVRHDPLNLVRILLLWPGSAAWALTAAGALAVVRRRFGFGSGYCAVGLAGALACQLAFFIVPMTSPYQALSWAGRQDVELVRSTITHPAGRQATVYWPNRDLATLWVDLGVEGYFQVHQAQGLLFSAQTASEASRRARLVGRFEMDSYRRRETALPECWVSLLSSYYRVGPDTAEPTPTDLRDLCADETVDYVILTRDVGGLYVASNGRVYVYDCRRIRERLMAGRQRPVAQPRS